MSAALSNAVPHRWRDVEAQFRRNLSPALFPSWQATCRAFGAAVSAGPGLVILVGNPGSGKTFTLLAYSEGAGAIASLRTIDKPIKPGAQLDLIDNLHPEALGRLTRFSGTRAVAAGPKLAERLVDAFPRARIVTVRPMLSRDVHVMVEVRRPQLGLPVGYFTSKALTRMHELCGGNPRRLDALLFRSLRLAAAAAVARVSPGHVEQAALQIEMELEGSGPDAGSADREAPWHWLAHAAGGRTRFDQPWRPMRTHAPDPRANSLVARRGPQPGWSRPVRQAVLSRDARMTMDPALPGPARGRTRRTRRVIPIIAGVGAVVVAVTVLGLSGVVSWMGGGGPVAAEADPAALGPLSPAVLPVAPPLPGPARTEAVPRPSPGDPDGPVLTEAPMYVTPVYVTPGPMAAGTPAPVIDPQRDGPSAQAGAADAAALPRNAREAARASILGKAPLSRSHLTLGRGRPG